MSRFFFGKEYTMDEILNVILNAVGVVGFPIVAYGAMFWYMIRKDEQHKEEMDAIRSSLDANTQALIKLTDHLDEKE